jgi:hypothetical protein
MCCSEVPGPAKCELGLESSKPLKEKYCDKIIQQHLSRDHHPKIAFAAVRTVAVKEHALLDLLLDAERKDLARSAEAAAVYDWCKCLQRPSARMIPLPRATKLDYAMTLGRTGGQSRSDRIHAQHSRTDQPPLIASASPGSQGKSNRSVRGFVVA